MYTCGIRRIAQCVTPTTYFTLKTAKAYVDIPESQRDIPIPIRRQFVSKTIDYGVVTTRLVHKGEIIVEYAGQEIGQVEHDLRELQYTTEGKPPAMFSLGRQHYLDGHVHRSGHPVMNPDLAMHASVNHSHMAPNAVVKGATIEGNRRIFIIANTNIDCNQEVLYDYKDNGTDAPDWMNST